MGYTVSGHAVNPSLGARIAGPPLYGPETVYPMSSLTWAETLHLWIRL